MFDDETASDLMRICVLAVFMQGKRVITTINDVSRN